MASGDDRAARSWGSVCRDWPRRAGPIIQRTPDRANIYVLIGKQSGGGGTSAYNHALAPLQGFQFRNRREHEGGLKPALEAERMVKESEIDNLRSSLRLNRSGKSDKKAISGEERGEISEKIGKLRTELQRIEKELAGPLFIASDCTPEGMARLLTLHGETLFHTDSDAGDALAAILGRYKQDSESSQTESRGSKATPASRSSLAAKRRAPYNRRALPSRTLFMHA